MVCPGGDSITPSTNHPSIPVIKYTLAPRDKGVGGLSKQHQLYVAMQLMRPAKSTQIVLLPWNSNKPLRN